MVNAYAMRQMRFILLEKKKNTVQVVGHKTGEKSVAIMSYLFSSLGCVQGRAFTPKEEDKLCRILALRWMGWHLCRGMRLLH